MIRRLALPVILLASLQGCAALWDAPDGEGPQYPPATEAYCANDETVVQVWRNGVAIDQYYCYSY